MASAPSCSSPISTGAVQSARARSFASSLAPGSQGTFFGASRRRPKASQHHAAPPRCSQPGTMSSCPEASSRLETYRYTYIYIYREREIERERYIYICIDIYIYIHIYIYI